jgi:nucleoside-diphosphate-sugar epimerase
MMPENSYVLAKTLAEAMARQMHRWKPGTPFIGLRRSNIIVDPLEYDMFDMLAARTRNLHVEPGEPCRQLRRCAKAALP